MEKWRTLDVRLAIVQQIVEQTLLLRNNDIFHGDIHEGNIVCKEKTEVVEGKKLKTFRCTFIDFEQSIFLNKDFASQIWHKFLLANDSENKFYGKNFFPPIYRLSLEIAKEPLLCDNLFAELPFNDLNVKEVKNLYGLSSNNSFFDSEYILREIFAKREAFCNKKLLGGLTTSELAKRRVFCQKVDERCLAMVIASVLKNKQRNFECIFELYAYQILKGIVH